MCVGEQKFEADGGEAPLSGTGEPGSLLQNLMAVLVVVRFVVGGHSLQLRASDKNKRTQ